MTVVLRKPSAKMPVKVMLAIPAYTGQIHMITMRSLMADVMELAARGYQAHLIDEIGNGLIGDCRAKFVARFLAEKEFTHLIMIDSDVCWTPGALPRLIEHGEDFVCGMYPHRSDPLTFNFRSALDDGEGLEVNEKGLIEVWGVPFGFVCLTRAACEKMVAAYEDLAFMAERGRDPGSKEVPGMKAWALFDPYRVKHPVGPDTKLGEDYAFCARWRDIGGKVLIDPSIPMGHTGLKTFDGRLGDFFEPKEQEQAA